MAIEIDIRVIGETTAAVVQELGAFAAHLSSGLGVGVHATNTPRTPQAQAPPRVDKANGADTPAKAARGGKKARRSARRALTSRPSSIALRSSTV